MGQAITFKHSFNSGDLITVLPGIKKICEEKGTKAIIYQRLNLPADYSHNDNHPIKDESGRMVCMNEKMLLMMKPLVEAQEYVERFDVWKGEKIDFDYDLTRQNSLMPLPGGSIHKWPSLIFPQLEANTDLAWINRNPETIKGSLADLCGCGEREYILINRTERYQNPYITYFFLKEYQRHLLFTGTKHEWEGFCKAWELHIPLLEAKDFLELSMAITGCRFFIGNQSLCWHIADAMKVPRILEVCSQYPNTFPTGKEGYSFVAQGALEYFFTKLLNETNA